MGEHRRAVELSQRFPATECKVVLVVRLARKQLFRHISRTSETRFGDAGAIEQIRALDSAIIAKTTHTDRQIAHLDGANIEIREAVGTDNFFLCGLSAEEVAARRTGYDPQAIVAADGDLREVIEVLQSGQFNLSEPGIFDPVIASILDPRDAWMTAADFASFVAAQRQVASTYQDRDRRPYY